MKLYGYEPWIVIKIVKRKADEFEMWCYYNIQVFNSTCCGKVTNEDILSRIKKKKKCDTLKKTKGIVI